MMRWIALFVTLLSVIGAACTTGQGDDGAGEGDRVPPAGEIALREGVHSRILEGSLEIEVRGAVELSWSGSTPLNVLTNVGAETPEAFWQLTVGIMPEHAVDVDGTRFRTAFDLLGYQGDGEYGLEASATEEGAEGEAPGGETPDDDGEAPPPGSLRGATLLFVVPPEVEQPMRFTELQEPCTLDVRDRGHAGEIDCPAVSGSDGQVAFTWSWEADPDAVIETLSGGQDPTGTRAPEDDRGEGAGDGDDSSDDGNGGTETDDGGSNDDGSDSDEGSATGIHADFPLEVTVDPNDCATVGTPVSVLVETTPNADVTLAMAYSDANSHGNAITGTAGPEGRFPWEFAVSPGAPEGQARLLVQVVTSDGDQSGGGILEVFTVESSC